MKIPKLATSLLTVFFGIGCSLRRSLRFLGRKLGQWSEHLHFQVCLSFAVDAWLIFLLVLLVDMCQTGHRSNSSALCRMFGGTQTYSGQVGGQCAEFCRRAAALEQITPAAHRW